MIKMLKHQKLLLAWCSHKKCTKKSSIHGLSVHTNRVGQPQPASKSVLKVSQGTFTTQSKSSSNVHRKTSKNIHLTDGLYSYHWWFVFILLSLMKRQQQPWNVWVFDILSARYTRDLHSTVYYCTTQFFQLLPLLHNA